MNDYTFLFWSKVIVAYCQLITDGLGLLSSRPKYIVIIKDNVHNKYPEGISKITILSSVSLKFNDLHNLCLLKRFYKTNPNYILEFSFDD